MKCSNCASDALYIYQGSGVRDTFYCPVCLPAFLIPLAKAGTLPTTQMYDDMKTQVQTRLLPTVVEDAQEDDAVTPEPDTDVSVDLVEAAESGDDVPTPRKRQQRRKPSTQEEA